MQTQDALVSTSRCIWSANVDGQVYICAGDVHVFLYVHLYVYARIETYWYTWTYTSTNNNHGM